MVALASLTRWPRNDNSKWERALGRRDSGGPFANGPYVRPWLHFGAYADSELCCGQHIYG
jgi:hypothetical protein